jgi:hypothetical protein
MHHRQDDGAAAVLGALVSWAPSTSPYALASFLVLGATGLQPGQSEAPSDPRLRSETPLSPGSLPVQS